MNDNEQASKNSAWIVKVRHLLEDGYGTEDIAVFLRCDIEDVRREVDILRQNGTLDAIIKRSKQ